MRVPSSIHLKVMFGLCLGIATWPLRAWAQETSPEVRWLSEPVIEAVAFASSPRALDVGILGGGSLKVQAAPWFMKAPSERLRWVSSVRVDVGALELPVAAWTVRHVESRGALALGMVARLDKLDINLEGGPGLVVVHETRTHQHRRRLASYANLALRDTAWNVSPALYADLALRLWIMPKVAVVWSFGAEAHWLWVDGQQRSRGDVKLAMGLAYAL